MVIVDNIAGTSHGLDWHTVCYTSCKVGYQLQEGHQWADHQWVGHQWEGYQWEEHWWVGHEWEGHLMKDRCQSVGKCPEVDPFVALAPAGEGQKMASTSHLNRELGRRESEEARHMCLACLNTGRTENATYHIAEQ